LASAFLAVIGVRFIGLARLARKPVKKRHVRSRDEFAFCTNARNEVCKQYGKLIRAVVSSGLHCR
jgi:hypothetical protein